MLKKPALAGGTLGYTLKKIGHPRLRSILARPATAETDCTRSPQADSYNETLPAAASSDIGRDMIVCSIENDWSPVRPFEARQAMWRVLAGQKL